jgi:hypothetical protein
MWLSRASFVLVGEGWVNNWMGSSRPSTVHLNHHHHHHHQQQQQQLQQHQSLCCRIMLLQVTMLRHIS